MIKWKKIAETQEYQKLYQIPRKYVRLLWVVDFWDFPRSGMALHQDQKRWFQLILEPDWESPSYDVPMALIELTSEQIEFQEHWNKLFCENVGAYWNYDENEVSYGTWQENANMQLFYEPYNNRDKSKEDFSENMVLGWFDLRKK
jgi:hypothetical protein